LSSLAPPPRRSTRTRRLLLASIVAGVGLAVWTLAARLCSAPTCRAGTDGLQVQIRTDWDQAPACSEPAPCLDAYDAFFEHPSTVAAAVPLTDRHTWHTELLYLGAAGIRPPAFPRGTSSPADPEQAILDGTHMGHLFEPASFHRRALDVVVRSKQIRTSPTGAVYRQHDLVLTDEFAGQFGALLLLPRGRGPFPAVVALPGHRESPEVFRDLHFGRFYPERGYALLIVGLRAYGANNDHEMTSRFLSSGFSLALMRAYEGLLALKFLQASPLACNSQLGLVGHSGGSLAGNLALWLSANPAVAHVTDTQSDYLNIDWPPQVDCETHPALARLERTINDLPSAPRPVVEVPYMFAPEGVLEPDPDDPTALDLILPFFDRAFEMSQVTPLEGGRSAPARRGR
jgi:hypothetical protein